MTLDYLQNACTLNFNKNGTYNFQSIRKGMYAEIFFMFILYFLTQLYQSVFFYRGKPCGHLRRRKDRIVTSCRQKY